MKKKKSKPMFLLIISLLLAGWLHAQESINTAGGDASGSGGSVAYSIGQTFFLNIDQASGRIDQGIQHPYEIFIVGTTELKKEIALSVFPNPTVNKLTLEVVDYDNEILNFQLKDVNGKLLTTGKITNQKTDIFMGIFWSATYFMFVYDTDNKLVRTFKIIKN